MSKINLNLIDRPALFEMARYIRTVKDGRANELRINGPLYFLISGMIYLIDRFLIPVGLSSSHDSVVVINLLIFICLSGLSLYLDFRRMNDIGVEKDLRNILVMINGFILLFSFLMVAFYDPKATYSPGNAIMFGFFIFIFIVYGMFMGVFLNFTSTDSSYVKRICKGFYDDSQIAEAYRYVMSERENILNFKEESYSKDESNSYSNELREVKKLYDEGILTKEEFEKAKKKILDI